MVNYAFNKTMGKFSFNAFLDIIFLKYAIIHMCWSKRYVCWKVWFIDASTCSKYSIRCKISYRDIQYRLYMWFKIIVCKTAFIDS